MYDKKFWNEHYTRDEYLYGTDPNSFLVENFGVLTGFLVRIFSISREYFRICRSLEH